MRPVTDLERRVAPFDVQSDYQPAGDQPAAIAEITERIRGGEKDVVLLGDRAWWSGGRRPATGVPDRAPDRSAPTALAGADR